MTREEAIAFLQEIKMNLDYLQTHYAEERLQKQEQAKVIERVYLSYYVLWHLIILYLS